MTTNETRTWKSKETADHYVNMADILVPNRQEILTIIGKTTRIFASDDARILDIGCGNGDVTTKVLEYAPNARICMIDFSDEMIVRSHIRFKGNKNITIMQYDLNHGLPDRLHSQEFDVVVSCFALHHIEFEKGIPLYSDIHRVLKTNGAFINGDRFKEQSPVIDKFMFDEWVTWMQHQIQEKLRRKTTFDEVKIRQENSDKELGDKPGTIWAMQQSLKQAGFTNVDCLFKAHQMGIIVALKQ